MVGNLTYISWNLKKWSNLIIKYSADLKQCLIASWGIIPSLCHLDSYCFNIFWDWCLQYCFLNHILTKLNQVAWNPNPLLQMCPVLVYYGCTVRLCIILLQNAVLHCSNVRYNNTAIKILLAAIILWTTTQNLYYTSLVLPPIIPNS